MQDRFKFRIISKSVWEGMLFYTIYNPIKIDDEEKKDIIIMQCTGLKDKNGKLIYEGDIVYKKGNKDHNGNKMFSTVVWDSMYAKFNISDNNGLHRMPSNSNNIEIIGNIYENKELLNEN